MVASYHPSYPRNGHLVSIASRTFGKQMRKVDFWHIFARLLKITNQGIILRSFCYLGREPFIYYIPQMSRLFCPQTSKVTFVRHSFEQLAGRAVLTTFREIGQTTVSAQGLKSLRPYWEMAFLLKRDQHGNIPENFCESNLFVSSIRTWTTSASMLTI